MTDSREMVTRAEFLQQVFKKSIKVGLDLTEAVVPLSRLTLLNENWLLIWNGNLPEGQPRFVFFQGRAYYLLNKEGKIYAFSGLCPKDSNLVSIHPNGGLTCTQCGGVFSLKGDNHQFQLQEYTTKVEGEKVFLAL